MKLSSLAPVLALLALLWLPVWALAQVLRGTSAQGPRRTDGSGPSVSGASSATNACSSRIASADQRSGR